MKRIWKERKNEGINEERKESKYVTVKECSKMTHRKLIVENHSAGRKEGKLKEKRKGG